MKRELLSGALAVVLATAGCAKPVEYQYIGTEIVRNEQGHVVGHKELLVDSRTGAEIEQVTNYSPRFDSKGEIVGYEEPVPGGALIRGVDGRRLGVRYTDLRSRGTNPGNEGISIEVKPEAKP
jgi:hypothetical protein